MPSKLLTSCLVITLTLVGLFLVSTRNVASGATDPPIEELGFALSGKAGDWEDITFESPGSGNYKITYNPKGDQGWAGAYWLYPASNWGDQPGRDLSDTGYTQVTFDAKSDNPNQKAKFLIGGITGKQFTDTLQPARFISATLQPDWVSLKIPLNTGSSNDLSGIIGGFGYVGYKEDGSSTVYIRNIAYS